MFVYIFMLLQNKYHYHYHIPGRKSPGRSRDHSHIVAITTKKMATRDGGGIALVNLEGKKPCKRTRRRFATKTEREIAAKGRKKRTDKTRITLGENYDEWERQRILCGGMANADFVVHLLAFHETTCPSFLHVKARLQANTDRFVTYFTLYIIMVMFHLTGLNYFRHVPSFLPYTVTGLGTWHVIVQNRYFDLLSLINVNCAHRR